MVPYAARKCLPDFLIMVIQFTIQFLYLKKKIYIGSLCLFPMTLSITPRAPPVCLYACACVCVRVQLYLRVCGQLCVCVCARTPFSVSAFLGTLFFLDLSNRNRINCGNYGMVKTCVSLDNALHPFFFRNIQSAPHLQNLFTFLQTCYPSVVLIWIRRSASCQNRNPQQSSVSPSSTLLSFS